VTVERQLERRFPDLVNKSLPFGFYFPHRLDYSTSGILCIAKNKRACSVAVEAFFLRNTQKYVLYGNEHLAQFKSESSIYVSLLPSIEINNSKLFHNI
jgi:23S rRNA-/tRNA-specific pseudouridylate synthase